MFDIKYKLIYQGGMMCIKGSYTIASYDENMIVLRCGNDNIFINGESLYIASLSQEEIYLKGSIAAIDFA
ncbi:MAG: hypothetical protein E7394_06285 [Ruminococcaceae bacterium]|nr:hypothetical protein [Oscillospiraceae bacterium]